MVFASLSVRKYLVLIGLVALTSLTIGFWVLGEKPDQAPPVSSSLTPYSRPGPYPVGMNHRVIHVNSPLVLTAWYPAESDAGHVETVTYSYEIKFGQPLGTVSIASFEGQAVVNAPRDFLEGPYPLVILSPGFSIGSTTYGWLAEHLASHGFVVLSPDHQEQLDPENQLWRSAITRPHEIQAILTYVDEQVEEGGEFERLIDKDTAAVIGHSYGGYTALVASGARFDTESFQILCDGAQKADEPGAWLCEKLVPHLADMADLAGLNSVPEELWPAWAADRVDAIVPMAGDALFFGQPGLAEVTVPVLSIGGTDDEDSPFAWGTQPTYEFASSSRKVLIGLIGAGHMIFTGPCEQVPWHLKLFSGEFCADQSWDRTYAHELIEHFVTAFLLAELQDDPDAAAALRWGDPGFPGINYQVVGY